MPVFASRSARRLPPAYGVVARLATALVLAVGLARPATARPLRLVAFGDSLTAGYNLPEADAFPTRLQAALARQGRDVEVVNAGVSGDTSADGLARLDWTLGDGADAVILELGANDMLRGIDPKVPDANLDRILAALKARHVPVLLAGMHTTPSMGRDYSDKFDVALGWLLSRE